MPAIQHSLTTQALCRQAVIETDATQRAEMIAHIRTRIEEERRLPLSPENSSYLVVAEMVMDFLEETLNSRYADTVQ